MRKDKIIKRPCRPHMATIDNDKKKLRRKAMEIC